MTVTPATLAVAAAFLEALGYDIGSGQIALRFENGRLVATGGQPRAVPAPLAGLAVSLRDTFGPPIGSEEILLNFSNRALQAIERRAEHFGAITTREYFRVGDKKALARDPS